MSAHADVIREGITTARGHLRAQARRILGVQAEGPTVALRALVDAEAAVAALERERDEALRAEDSLRAMLAAAATARDEAHEALREITDAYDLHDAVGTARAVLGGGS